MEFTGERFHPELLREIWYEHYHRYAFALPLVTGRRVLDVACGEGYGSALLASRAAEVIGVDRSAEAVAHARDRYHASHLSFLEADATGLPLADRSIEAVVSFETIEHLEPQAEMLDELERVLADDGLLILSSPDRRTYSDERGYENEHHVRELYRHELEALLVPRFPARRLLGQKLAFVSHIWDPERSEGVVQRAGCTREGEELRDWPLEPLYWIAVCARDQDVLERLEICDSLFVDPEESVYAHYYHEIRKNMAAGAIISERDARIAELEAQLAAALDATGEPGREQGPEHGSRHGPEQGEEQGNGI